MGLGCSRAAATALLIHSLSAAGCVLLDPNGRGDGRTAAATVGIAHRGASGIAPEHTLAAYDLAVALGSHYIEPDLQQTADGELVILHDVTLDRTARGPAETCSGRVADKTVAQLRTCDFGSWFSDAFEGARIVTLEELLDRYGSRVRYYIETKHPEHSAEMEEALVVLLRRHGYVPAPPEQTSVIVQSFSRESLMRMRTLAPGIPRILLLEAGQLGNQPGTRLDEIAGYAQGIGPNLRDVDARLVELARERGLLVHPWVANEWAELEQLIELGVDGIFTDRIDRFMRLKAPTER